MWVLGGRTIGIGLAFAANMVLARRLSPADFGLFIVLISIVTFGSIVGRFGLDRALVRFLSESLGAGDMSRVRQTLKSAAFLAATSSLCTAFACGALLQIFGESRLGLPKSIVIVGTAAVGLVLLTFLQLLAECHRGFHELRFSSLFDAQNSGPLINLLFLVFLLTAAGREQTLESALGLYVASVGSIVPVASLCLWWTIRHARRTEKSSGDAARLIPFSFRTFVGVCVPIMLAQVLAFGSAQADIWIAAMWCSGEQVALFGAARRLMQMIALPLAMINMTVISTIPELYTQGRLRELQRVLQTTASLAALPAVLALVTLLAFPKAILAATYGPYYGQAASVLMVLCLGQLVLSWTGSCGNSLMVTGKQNTVLGINTVMALAMFLFGSLAAIKFGLIGLAVVSATVEAIRNLAMWLCAKKMLGFWTHATWNLSRSRLAIGS